MIAAQVIGNDATITVAGQSGNFQLNVMLPVIAYNLLQSIELLGIASRNLADHAIAGFEVERGGASRAALDRNPILVTALNPIIGYEKGAAIAKKAYAEGRPILEVAAEMTDLSDVEELRSCSIRSALTRRRPEGRRDGRVTRRLRSVPRRRIRESLDPAPSAPDEDMLWLAGVAPRSRARCAPAAGARSPAAVLVPLVERESGWTVLLTQRAATLKDHAGQISFPGRPHRARRSRTRGGRRCARPTRRSACPRAVEFAGYLPDHWVGTGFRVTPVVGFVDPLFELRIATAEVHDGSRCRSIPLRRGQSQVPAAANGRPHRGGLRHPLRGAHHLGRDRRHADDLGDSLSNGMVSLYAEGTAPGQLETAFHALRLLLGTYHHLAAWPLPDIVHRRRRKSGHGTPGSRECRHHRAAGHGSA